MYGHGFLPRVTSRNRAGVLRTLSPTDLFGGQPPPVPWVVLDGADAHADPTVSSGLRNSGCARIVDTQAWRFARPEAWATRKWSSLPYTPPGPYDGTEPWIRRYVRADLVFQAQVGTEAYLLPGWIGARGDSPRDMLAMVFTAAERLVGSEVDAKPLIATLPMWRMAVDVARDAVQDLNGGLSGVYALINKWNPITAPVDSLEEVARLLLELEAAHFPVIVARGGTITPVLRALGVSAADAGLAEAETFDQAAATRRPAPLKTGRGYPQPGPRMYVPAVGISVSGSRWRAMTAVPAVAAAVTCDQRCCRYAGATGQAQDHAVEHSLTSRVSEARAVEGLTSDIRLDHAYELVQQRISKLRSINAALREAGQPEIRHGHLDNQLALLTRFSQRAEAG